MPTLLKKAVEDNPRCQTRIYFDGIDAAGLKEPMKLLAYFDYVETLSPQEAQVLEEAMFIEWCDHHKGFHMIAPDINVVLWLMELRRP
jgi:hypothetical protein